MADANETIAAILAEMRRDADILVFPNLTPDKLRTYASRIEAAADRERNAHTNDIHDALYKATGIPGNAAAMRAALVSVKEKLSGWWEWLEVEDAVEAALAAPARNCDRFATADEARKAFEAAHSRGIVRNLYTEAFDWLFAPAKEDPKP